MKESLLVAETNEFIRKDTACKNDIVAWYALYTRPRAEKKVSERLAKLSYDVYLPLISTVRQWSDRKKRVQLPLISSIIFVKTTPHDLRLALQCEGVLSVVRFLGEPAKVRECEINNLRILLREPDTLVDLEQDESLENGVPVRVIRGPFLGVVGICVHLKGRHSLVIEIGALNRRLKLTLPVSFVEKETVVTALV